MVVFLCHFLGLCPRSAGCVPIYQAFNLSPDLCLGEAQSFKEEKTVQAGTQIDYTKFYLYRCANICLMMSQSSPYHLVEEQRRRWTVDITAQSYCLELKQGWSLSALSVWS